jgi:tetratricopeptide (TPR) repeat protein
MNLTWHNTLTFKLPLLAGILVIALIPILTLNKNVSNWKSSTSEYMLSSDLSAMDLRIQKISENVDLIYTQISTDLMTATEYLRESMVNKIPVSTYLETYYGDKSIDPRIPPKDFENGQKFSMTYKNGIVNMQDLMNTAYINETANADMIFRSILKSSGGLYTKFLLGLSNGLFRRYPYSVAPNDYSYGSYCTNSIIGYDPRCRPWYIQSLTAKNVTYSSPYVDALTKKLVMSISLGVYIDNSFKGVLSIECDMNSIDTQISNVKAYDTGYVFLMDALGGLVSYPNLDRTQANTDIFHTEPNVDAQVWNTLLKSKSDNTIKVNKNNVQWYITYNYLKSSDQYIVMMVATDDVNKYSNDLNNDLTTQFNSQIYALAFTMAFVCIISFVLAIRSNNNYIARFNKVNDVMTMLKNGNLDAALSDDILISPELIDIAEKIKSLNLVLKFGNNSYYANKPEQSLKDNLELRELMDKTKNLRGMGICNNTIAASYNKLSIKTNNHGDKIRMKEEAIKYYNEAITFAKQLIASNKNNQKKFEEYTIALGIRLNNLATLYQDHGDVHNANRYYTESLECYKEVDNSLGIAQVSGNIGQMHIAAKRYNEAETILLNSYEQIARKKEDDLSLQYVTRNLGLVYESMGNYNEAIKWYHYNFDSFELIDVEVQEFCLMQLVQCCKMVGNNDLVREIFPLVRNKLMKYVLFVLDCSTSMNSLTINNKTTCIQECRSSIESIISKHLSNIDQISLITFSDHWREVMPFTGRGENNSAEYKTIVSTIRNNTIADGNTAFYDAVYNAVKSMENIGGSLRNKWIVALTDGADNRSSINDKDVIALLKANYINLAIITIGTPSNENIIKQIAEAARINGNGHFIKIDTKNSSNNDNTIEKAFNKVAQMISGQVVLESF